MAPLVASDKQSGDDAIPFKAPQAMAEKESADEEDDDDDEEGGEDEYVIESIKNHDWDRTGQVVYEVKWEGYDSPSDLTWEPEENLESAKETLAAYWSSIGGKPSKQEPAKKGKKRKAESTPTTKGRQAKRGKSETPELSTRKKTARAGGKEITLPKGNWEKDVQEIDTIEEARDENGDLQRYVYVIWTTGNKTRHALSTVTQKCPQKMLRYYESHLVFRALDNAANGNDSAETADAGEAVHES